MFEETTSKVEAIKKMFNELQQIVHDLKVLDVNSQNDILIHESIKNKTTDIITGCQAALDYMMWDILTKHSHIQNLPKKISRIYFPLYYENKSEYIKKMKQYTDNLDSKIFQALENIQYYNKSEDRGWMGVVYRNLGAAKHRHRIDPLKFHLELFNGKIRIGRGARVEWHNQLVVKTKDQFIINCPIDRPMEPGEIYYYINKFTIIDGIINSNVKVVGKGNFETDDINWCKPKIDALLENKPLIQSLDEMIKGVISIQNNLLLCIETN